MAITQRNVKQRGIVAVIWKFYRGFIYYGHNLQKHKTMDRRRFFVSTITAASLVGFIPGAAAEMNRLRLRHSVVIQERSGMPCLC